MTLTRSLAHQFAQSTLSHVGRAYPHAAGRVITSPHMIDPEKDHPVFFGSFDWHSCVHGWWQLFKLARLQPELQESVYAKANGTFTVERVQGELAFLSKEKTFERPYGWGWLLALHQEMSRQDNDSLRPLAHFISERFADYLPRLTYPVRAGTHGNTSFALIHALRWARVNDRALADLIVNWSQDRLLNDVARAETEPSGEDFLSPTLVEAHLMSEVLPAPTFRDWLEYGFMPTFPSELREPCVVSDRTDGRIAHLDGLNLSRGWNLNRLALLSPKHRTDALSAAERHIEAALHHLQDDYMGEHWLASFALLALADED